LIGTHVDYNEGFVLPCCDHTKCLGAARRESGSIVTILSLDMNEQIEFNLNNLPAKQTTENQPLSEWAQYAAGVAWALREHGIDVSGAQMALTGDVPVGAGLSSSAAVEVAYAFAWARMTGWDVDESFDR
jgi:galactokinase